MACRQAHSNAGRPAARRRLKLWALPAAAALLVWGCRPFSRGMKISGEITVAAPLVSRLPRDNSTLFIVVTNLGGVPVAVKRIVNPRFPVRYQMTDQDLVVPGTHPEDPLTIEVEMNSHGNVGAPVKGDLAGVYPDAISSRQSRVHLLVDRIVEDKASYQVTSRGWRRRPAENVPWADRYR